MKPKTPISKSKSASPRADASKKPAKAPSPASKTKAKRTIKAKTGAAAVAPPPAALQRNSKQAQLIASLKAASGTTIAKMMTLTGWQAHTVRGTISGVLRKKLGLNVTCDASADSDERVYRIAASAIPA